MLSGPLWFRLRRTENNTDELLLARVTDAARLVPNGQSRASSAFWTKGRRRSRRAAIRREHEVQAHLFGGYEGALRVVLGIFPWEIYPEEDFFPVVPLTVRYRPRDTLTHRDFLGTLMAQGIRRDCVGDILVGEGLAVLFLLKEIVPFVLNQMEKVGGVGVQLIEGLPDGLPQGKGTKELTDTVASPRLDAVVASVCRVSRRKPPGGLRGARCGQSSAGYCGQRDGKGRGYPVGPGKRPVSNHPGGATYQKGSASV